MKVGSVGRRGGEMFRRRVNLGKHRTEIFYKLSAFPVYHLLRDSKHIQTPEFLHFSDTFGTLFGLHKLDEWPIIYRLNRTVTI